MSEQLLDQARVDRTAFSVSSLAEAEQADLEYWRQRTPDERLEALETEPSNRLWLRPDGSKLIEAF